MDESDLEDDAEHEESSGSKLPANRRESTKKGALSLGQVACMLTVSKRGVHGLVHPRPKSKAGGNVHFGRSRSSGSTPSGHWNLVHEELKNMRAKRAKDQLREFQVFKQLKPAVQEQLLECVKYAKLDDGTPLFMQGSIPGVDDPGECYFILTGTVGIWVQSEEDRDDAKGIGRRESDPQVWLGKNVATVHPGTLLGNVALMNGKPRNATCICDGTLELLYIRRQDFMRVLRDSMENLLDSKGQFLEKHLPGLKKLSEVRSEHVLHNFHRRIFKRGHSFLQEGVAVKEAALYVIHKGTVEVRAKGFLVGALIPGAVFGTSPAHNVPEEFTYTAAPSCVEAYEVHGRDVQKLPLLLRQDILKHISSLRLWHKRRLKEASATAAAGKKPGHQGLLSPLSMSELQSVSELQSAVASSRPGSSPGSTRAALSPLNLGSPSSLSGSMLTPMSGPQSPGSPLLASNSGYEVVKPSSAPGAPRSHLMRLQRDRADALSLGDTEPKSKAKKNLIAIQGASQHQWDSMSSSGHRRLELADSLTGDSLSSPTRKSVSPSHSITAWGPDNSMTLTPSNISVGLLSTPDRESWRIPSRSSNASSRHEASWEKPRNDRSEGCLEYQTQVPISKAHQLRRHRAKIAGFHGQQPVGPIFRTEKAKSQIAKAKEVLVKLRRMP
mmetsp:Transcript_61390/g.146282  ORF Transcript_61390/g.146282 Transcript_61390/m.146282 type:complete len:667 (-) Transcript_61390:80-2080(-)